MSSNLREDVPLASYTTLGAGGNADYFAEPETVEELHEVLLWAERHAQHVTILGGGSNVLIADSGIRGLVVKPNVKDITYEASEGEKMLVTASAGVVLDDLVHELVEKDLWGLENLSAIPGTVGAVPIQNVGAYGVEVQKIIHHVTIYDPSTKEMRDVSNAECLFGYRDSIFKHAEGNRYIIISVTFLVSKKSHPLITYRDLALHFENTISPSLSEIRTAVIAIRSKKFPDWNTVGTAGSFFKNPIIEKKEFEQLRAHYPDMPGYPTETGRIKISLGWVLDRVCNLRGYSEEAIGLYKEQALVLVCAKGTSAHAIEVFSQKIIDTVFAKTKISIEREVTLLK